MITHVISSMYVFCKYSRAPIEQRHDKPNKMVDSEKPENQPNLISLRCPRKERLIH